MKVDNTRKVVENLGVASTLDAEAFIPFYTERVDKFLRDNSSLGDKWVKDAASKLYIFNRNSDGEVIGSNTYTGVAIATLCPEIPQITGRQILNIQRNAGNRTPFGLVYVDFGVQVNGTPDTNKSQAEFLLDDYKSRGIDNTEILVPNFHQLRLVADKDAGLVFRLAEDVGQDNLTPASEYTFGNYVGKNGLFRAYVYDDGGFGANDDDLSNSSDSGRVVRYDAEGVDPQKISVPEEDLVGKLRKDFLSKFE